MMSEYIEKDLGFRRRAFRQMDGEITYDFRCRKLMERQERKRLVNGGVIWTRGMGSFDKEYYGMMTAKPEEVPTDG